MRPNKAVEVHDGSQVIHIAGYEYAQAIPVESILKGSPVVAGVLRPVTYTARGIGGNCDIYSPYKRPEMLTDFLNTDFYDYLSLLSFVNKYGLLNPVRLTDSSDGFHYNGDVLKDTLHEASHAQLAFELSNILFEVSRKNKAEDDIIKLGEIEYDCPEGRHIRFSKIKFTSEKYDIFQYSQARYFDFSPNKIINNAFCLMITIVEEYLHKHPYSTMYAITNSGEEVGIERTRYSGSLLGTLWDFVSDSIGNGGYMRRCAHCGKWFRYERNKARMCGNTCRQAALRARKKSTAQP